MVGLTIAAEHGHEVLHEDAGVPEPFVVAGPLWEVGEPGAEVGLGVAEELCFGDVAEEGLDDREGDQFGVGRVLAADSIQ